MNFLELCRKVQLKADVPGTQIAAVTSQVGILNRIVGWVEDAWLDIQGSQDWWSFLRKSDTAALSVGINAYYITNLMPADFNYFREDSIYIKENGVAKAQLAVMTWEDYTDNFLHVDLKTNIPSALTISPSGQIVFNALPDAVYTIHFDYQIKQETLSDNLDVPTLPEDFHDVIWRKALVSYGEHYGAPEVYQPASLYLEERLQIMEDRYLPKVTFRDNVYASG